MQVPEHWEQPLILDGPGTHRSIPPGIVPAATDGEGGAHACDPMRVFVSPNIRVSHVDSLAKYAAVGSSGESNTRLQYSRWRLKAQCLSWTLIQANRDPVQVCLGVL
jgi:hypothetical protein